MRGHAVSESGDRSTGSAAVLQRVSAMVFGDGARRYCVRCHHKCKAALGTDLNAQARQWVMTEAGVRTHTHDRDWCRSQALAIGPACTHLIEQLLADRILERLWAAQGVLRLAERLRYGPPGSAACRRALAHDGPFYRTVKTILAGGFDQHPLATAAPSAPPYARGARFVRDAEDLFASNPRRLFTDPKDPAHEPRS